MNKKEEFKTYVINCCISGTLTVKQAAKKLCLSERYVKKLKRSFRDNERNTLLHGNCGRQPKVTIDSNIKSKILETRALPEFGEVNNSHFKEILEEKYNIKISYSALSKLFKNNSIVSQRTHKKKKIHKRRLPREKAGELLQADGTPHSFFKNSNKKQSLHGFIDDATGNITGLYMCENECMQGYLEVTRQTFKNFGIPISIYADGSSIFFNNIKREITIEEMLDDYEKPTTQYSRMMDEFGIQLIRARSPQAKGKIERLWNTLHDRLRVEFAMNDITTIEDANKFLKKYLNKYNKKFAKEPTNNVSAYIPLPEYANLDILLSVKEVRTPDASNTVSINGTLFKINCNEILHKKKITICINKKIGIKALYKDKLYNVIPIFNKNNLTISSSDSIENIINNFVFYYCFKNERVSV